MSPFAQTVTGGSLASFGIVVIGRNEGERLRRCLASCRRGAACVYVDSNSSDGSIDLARGVGIDVVELDLSVGFTAARARNAGFERLMTLLPDAVYVAFIDGDCEWVDGWLDSALGFLEASPDVVAVCGRRRERFPEASVFNRLCDIEWDTPPGDAKSVGGDAVFRVAAFREAGGYRADLIAGEEPELCVRLRAAGGRIRRIAGDMTWHDAAMTRFGQWWRRNVRSGHAFAQGASLHGAPPERHFVSETRRAVVWGAVLPLCIVILAMVTPWAWSVLLIYPFQWFRVAVRSSRDGKPMPFAYAGFLVAGRLPEAQGVIKFWIGSLLGKRSAIIEYK